jgi:hypothetical protein
MTDDTLQVSACFNSLCDFSSFIKDPLFSIGGESLL